MTNGDLNEEKVLGRGIEAIFRRTKQLEETSGRNVTFDRGSAYINGDEVVVKLTLEPNERVVAALRHVLEEAERGLFDPLDDKIKLRKTAHSDALSAAKSFKEADYNKAIRHYLKALEIIEEPIYLFNLALAYEKLDRLNEAAELYRRIVRNDPHDATALNNLSVVYYSLGEFTLALEVLGQAVAIDPTLSQQSGETMFCSRSEPRPIES